VWCLSRRPCYGLAAYSLPVDPEKAVVMEEVNLYVGNLPKSMTGKELNTFFAQAGDVTSVNLITDRQNGGSKGYAFVTMSSQSEADKAVSMFNTYSLDDHRLKVALAKPREQRGFGTTY
jgi:RNA recognition motif-containing protein